ncbi:hypothetical protein L9F63_012810, partial [Diploptera punctata]
YSQKEIESKVAAYRNMLVDNDGGKPTALPRDEFGRVTKTQHFNERVLFERLWRGTFQAIVAEQSCCCHCFPPPPMLPPPP